MTKQTQRYTFLGCLCNLMAFLQLSQAQQVFKELETLPVRGMPEIRAALPVGEKIYKPVIYRADKGGWVVVADSFASYKSRCLQSADSGLNGSERTPAPAAKEQPAAFGFSADTPNQAATTLVGQPGTWLPTQLRVPPRRSLCDFEWLGIEFGHGCWFQPEPGR